jgi:polysaccharide biosynthesis transport protein
MVENIRNDYLAAVQREKLLADAVAQEKLEVGRVSQLLIEHNLLKRDFDSNQQLYESLLQHLKDANVSAGLRATNIHLIDAASVPTAPVRPQRARNVAFAMAVGLALGMGMAFAKEALANSIKGAQEVESLIAAPALAIVPDVSSMSGYRAGFFAKRSEAKAKKTEMVELSVLKNPGASISEAFRTLRTSIMLSTAEHPPQVLLITSSQPHEGKTSTSLNLAFTLAQMGSRILIIDADLRKRRVAKALNLSTEKGLSGILTGAYSLEEALVRVEDTEGLYALSSGPNPPNPAELLCSMKMQDLLKRTREQFDHVILDSPPVLPITDATILASKVDGVVIVVENEETTRAALSRACGVIRHSGGKILGAVLNKVDSRRDGYYGHYHYYGYYSKGYYDYSQEKGNGNG